MTIQPLKITIPHTSSSTELLVVGPNVQDVDILLSGLARPVEILRLAHDTNPLAQIAHALSNRSETSVLHILAHGEPGAIHLGGNLIDVAELDRQEDHIEAIRDALPGNAKIALWSCSVAQDEVGERFIGMLEEKIDVTVFASDRAVGAESQGGDWRIGTASPFTKLTEDKYLHILPATSETFDVSELGSGTEYVYGDWTFSTPDTSTVFHVNGTMRFNFLDESGVQNFVFRPTDGTNFQLNSFLIISHNTDDVTISVSQDGTEIGSESFNIASDTITKNGITWDNDNGIFTFDSTFNNVDEVHIETAVSTGVEIDNINVSPAVVNSAPEFDDADDIITLTVAEDGGATTIADIEVTDTNVGDTLTWVEGSTKAQHGTVSITGTASASGNAGDLPTTYTYTPNANVEGGDTFTIDVSDGNGGTDTLTVNVTITAVNDDPEVSGLPSDVEITANSASNVDLSAVSFTDVDSDTGYISLRLSVTTGTLTAGNDGGVSVSGSGTAAITLTATATEIDSYLNTASNIQFTGTPGTLTLTANDDGNSGTGGGTDVALGTVNLALAPVAPEFDDADDTITLTVAEDAGATTIAGIEVTDPNVGDTLTWVEGSTKAQKGTVSFTGTPSATGNAGDLPTTYTYTPNADAEGSDTFTIDVSDGNGGTDTLTVNVTITPENDAPVVTPSAGTTAFTENGFVFIDSALSVTDVDDGDLLTSATITIESGYEAGSDAIEASQALAVDGIDGAATNSNILTLTASAGATAATWQEALQKVIFLNTSDTPSTADRVISFVLNDGDASSVAATKTVSVTAENDIPVVTVSAGSASFTEGGSAVVLDSAATISDPDHATYTGVRLHISSGYQSGDVLALPAGTPGIGTITAAYEQGVPGLLELSPNGGNPTDAEWEAALQAITFYNPSDDLTASRTVSIWADDASDDTSATATRTISITDVNDAPTLTATGSDPAYLTGGAVGNLFGSASASATETSQNISGLVLTVTNVTDGAGEILNIDGSAVSLNDGFSATTATNSFGAAVSVSGNTATLTLSGGNASAGNMNTLINSISYENTSTSATAGDRVVTLTSVTDTGGTAAGGVDTTAVNIASTVSVTVRTPYIVNTLLDSGDDLTVTGDLAAETADGGGLSLREALLLANADPGADVIRFDSTVFAGGQTIALDRPAGELLITDSVTIDGDIDDDGQSDVTLDASFEIRILNITGGTNVLDSLIIKDPSANDGGGIAVSGASTNLTLQNSMVTGGEATNGGVHLHASGGANVTITDSLFTGGGSTNGASVAFVGAGTTNITNSIIAGVDGGGGGGLLIDNSTVAVSKSTITGNFGRNTAGADQVAVKNGGTLNISDSIVSGGGTPDDILVEAGAAVNVTGSLVVSHAFTPTSGTGATHPVTDIFGATADNNGVTGGAVANGGIIMQPAFSALGANAKPVVTLSSTSTLAFTEDAGPVAIDSGLTLIDASDTVLSSATIDIGTGLESASDVLALTVDPATMGNIAVTGYNASEGTLTLQSAGATATVAEWQAALRAVTFNNTSQTPSTANREITFTVNDGKVDSVGAVRTVSVTDVPEQATPTPTPDDNSGSSNPPEPVVVLAVEDTDNSNDTIVGADLNDTIEAGGGDDTVSGGAGQDSLDGGNGKDTIDGGDDNDFIRGGAGDDSIEGATGDDTLIGGADSDTIEAGSGDDIIWAGSQDDSVDKVTGDEGNDKMGAGGGDDTLSGGAGNDTVYGAGGDDTVDGGDGTDELFGGTGNDTVSGGAGDDQIWGGAGDDSLVGGSGSDVFSFITGFGTDVISDFGTGAGNQDVLDLSAFDDLTLSGLLEAASFTDGNTTLTIEGHGTIILSGITEDELNAMFDAGQILVG